MDSNVQPSNSGSAQQQSLLPTLSNEEFSSAAEGLLEMAHQHQAHLDVNGSIVVFLVGAEQVEFTIHKKLLLEVAPVFIEYLSSGVDENERVVLAEELSSMFRLFVTYVYSGQMPVASSTMTHLQQSDRLRDLCQLFTFAEKLYLPHTFTNHIMDLIQDGCLLAGTLPSTGLIQEVYQKTDEYCKLRQFMVHCVFFGMRSDEFKCYDDIGPLLQESEFMDDFISAIKDIDGIKMDPRVRDCEGEEGCAECAAGRVIPHPGYWPCSFHIHEIVRKSVGESDANGNTPMAIQDTGCYLWHK